MVTKMMKNKSIAVFLLFVMLIPLFGSFATVLAEGNTVLIYSAEDFYSLAQKCKTDTWSQNKVVELKADIDLSKTDFTPIPTFGGIWRGNGYTISGVTITQKGSALGLFRYIQKSGTVENLNVSGTVTPGGTAEKIGGICGENSGTIQNCSFTGTVSGNTGSGGICGYQTESGKIINARFTGTMTSKNYAGGICGQNFGTVEGCENHGSVNTTDTEPKKSLQDMKLDTTDIDVKKIRSVENQNITTDAGGICGYSKGNVLRCTNYGSVGYPSVGYNVGGICGRQAGYIGECENRGEVNGRKDVGGICGQAEPYVMLEFTEDMLKGMRRLLSDLTDTMHSSLNSSDSAISDHVNSINDTISGVSDNMETISGQLTDYTTDLTDSVNKASDRVHKALEDSKPALDSLSSATGKMADGLEALTESTDYLSQACKELSEAAKKNDDATNHFNSASSYLEKASDQLAQAHRELSYVSDSIQDGLTDLRSALRGLSDALRDHRDARGEIKQVIDSIQKIQERLNDAAGSIRDVVKILDELYKQGFISSTVKDTITALRDLANSYEMIAKSLHSVMDAFWLMSDNLDFYALHEALRLIEKGLNNLSKAIPQLRKAVDALRPALDSIKTASETAQKAADSAKKATEHMKSGADELKKSIDTLRSVVDTLSSDGAIQVPTPSDDFRANMDSLFDSIQSMQDAFSSLNQTVSDKKDNLIDDLDTMTREFEAITDLLMDTYDDATGKEKEDIIKDVSDQDTGGTRGKIDASHNIGLVKGDVNVGGICGSMAIEYDFDPEDDVTKNGSRTLQFTYKTKAILRRCTNDAEINAKKNSSGGIVCRMNLGTVIGCDNYGAVTTEDGSYVGGIAGFSDSVIRSSAAKCQLSGKDYVGGIVGKGSTVSSCAALVTVTEHEEYAGSIAGNAPKESLWRNRFVENDLGGLDDISYAGYAEPTDIQGFVSFMKSGFNKDVTFTLTFVADDKEIATLPFVYKTPIPEDQIPKVPEKKGYYGKWSDYDFTQPLYDTTLTAEYHRNMDIITSETTRDDGKSIILICGAFDDAAHVTAESAGALSGKTTIDSYNVAISGTYTERYTVRYLPKSEKGHTDLYIQNGDTLEKVSTKQFGSYREFSVADSQFTLYEVEKNYLALILVSVLAAVAVLFALLTLFRLKKRKNGTTPTDRSTKPTQKKSLRKHKTSAETAPEE